MPLVYRRSVIKDAIGKVRAYLSHRSAWEQAGKKEGKPGLPGARNHPSLYQGTIKLSVGQADHRERFVRLKVYTGAFWRWVNYPVRVSRYFERRRTEAGWEQQSPRLVLRKTTAELHISQTKAIKAKQVIESKQDPHLVTVAVDLNVKNLAVITVRQDGKISETVFARDHGLDHHRYRHLKRIAKKQWLAGKPVKGEHSNQQLWGHVRRMNEDAAHKVAFAIATVCAKYLGSVLLFERLRKIKATGASKSRRMNRRQANQLRGKINQYARDKAFAQGVVTVEVNPHGTSQYCSRCGAKGERFSNLGGKRVKAKWGKLFCCPVCHYEANADLNASKNVHHAFYRQWHWQPRKKAPPKAAHLHEDLTVEAMAARAVMSPRTFARRFRATLGASPYHWLLQQRIALAQRLLETTDDPIERIATRCGFSSAATLRLHFRRLSPQSYRTTFHSASA